MNSWHSYPKIYNLGHSALEELFRDPVIVEEKIDGSQFSFGKFLEEDGKEFLRFRSKGAQLNEVAPERMFEKAIEVVKEIRPLLTLGFTYRAEYLAKPKHNTLAYDRIPEKHLILFDINPSEERYLSYDEKKHEANKLGLEIVPLIHNGVVSDVQMFRDLLEKESVLGGQKVEGVVVKNYQRFGRDGKALMGKFVSEAFKETHAGDWKERHPSHADIIEVLIGKYRTPARWGKAIQHLREKGQIENDPRDIGKLIKEVPPDVLSECEEMIKQDLLSWAWPKISRGITRGLPEWYKDKLLVSQFEQE